MKKRKLKWGLTLVTLVFCLHLTHKPSLSEAKNREEIAVLTSDKSRKELSDTFPEGRILHLPSSPSKEEEEKLLEQLLADEKIRLVILSPHITEKATLAKRIRENRPELLLFSVEQEPEQTPPPVDLRLIVKTQSETLSLPLAAKSMGAKKLVLLTLTTENNSEPLVSERLSSACSTTKLPFIQEKLSLPSGANSVETERMLLKKIPELIRKHGGQTAFYCDDADFSRPIIRQVAKYGGYFIEPAGNTPLENFKKALDLKPMGNAATDEQEALKQVERGIIRSGSKGRMGATLFAYDSAPIKALIRFGALVSKGDKKLKDEKALQGCLDSISIRGGWDLTSLPSSKKDAPHTYQLQQRYYIFGKGFLAD